MADCAGFVDLSAGPGKSVAASSFSPASGIAGVSISRAAQTFLVVGCLIILNAFVTWEMSRRLSSPEGLLPVLDAMWQVHASRQAELPWFFGMASTLALSGAGIVAILTNHLSGGRILTQDDGTSPLANYALERKLGEGAFGAVYRATKEVPDMEGPGTTKKDFALKIIPVYRIKEANLAIAEAMRLACVDHPCVVDVHEHFFDKQAATLMERVFSSSSRLRLCIAQELCSGDLQMEVRRWAAAQGRKDPKLQVEPRLRPSWAQLLRVLKEIVEGLEALHSKGIIHRDLKPANIFISADLKHVRIGDLGIAERVEMRQVAVEGLGTAGTPGYMAPEVMKGNAYSTRVDNWSVACILVDMAYPTAEGGWSLRSILDDAGHKAEPPTLEGIEVVAQHPAVTANSVAQRLVKHCLVQDPQLRWGCSETLQQLKMLPAVRSDFLIAPPEGHHLWNSVPLNTQWGAKPLGPRGGVSGDLSEEGSDVKISRRRTDTFDALGVADDLLLDEASNPWMRQLSREC